MNVQSLPEYDASVYSHNMLFVDSGSKWMYLIVSTEPLQYSTSGSYHRANASVDTDYKAYYTKDSTVTWNTSWSGTIKANNYAQFQKYGTATDIVYDEVLATPTPEPTPTPEATPTPTSIPEATPEASPEATTAPTLPPNIDVTVVVGEEVIESLNSIQTLNAENKELLATIQEVNNESMAVLYSQYDSQQNFNFAVMALLGLIFGAIFIKGIFYKR